MEEIFCPCGCGATIMYPMEKREGKWYVLPIPEGYLRSLESVQHPRTH
jgi:hypothetical protein